MTDDTVETSPRLKARIAGGLYLIITIAGIFAGVFVPRANREIRRET